jgi:hypothetical protein
VARELLERWRGQLGELGAMGAALRAAIGRDDVVGAIAAAVRVRQLRADLVGLGDGTGDAQLSYDRDELAAIAEITQLTGDARRAEATLAAWLARPLPADDVLLGSPLGVAVLADALLPAVWDLARDVVVIVGDALEPVAGVLASLGQQRVVRHAADRSIDKLTADIRAMAACAPGRMVVRTEAGVPRDTGEAIAAAATAALSDLRVQRNTVATFSQTWADQGLANLPALARWPSIASVGDRMRGLPIAIVAPGPSLARNAHLLRELRGRCVIVALSHALRAVVAAGVQPDLVVAVDPQDLRYHFAGCDVSGSYLVNGATVHPALFDLGARGYLGAASNATIDDWAFDPVGENASVAGGGSVATTALSLALRWGCDPIMFVGLDLSFTGGAYYASTSVDGNARANVGADGMLRVDGWSSGFHAMKAAGGPAAGRERVVELPGWHGGTVPSSFMFSMFHRWFVDRIAALGGTGPRIYNCTEGGAFIAGMSHRPLADAIAELPTAGVDGVAALDATVAATDGAARSTRVARHLDVQLRALARARQLARRAKQLAATRDPRLATVEAKLAGELRPLRVASLLAQRELEAATDQAMRPATADQYLAASVRVFDALVAVLDRLEPALRHARKELRRSHARAA